MFLIGSKENSMTGLESAASRARCVRREVRLHSHEREKRVLDMLNAGVSMADIASREGVTRRRMQIVLKDILARRAPQPPAKYLALETSRLNQAMSLAYDAMTDGDLSAAREVVRLVSEMDNLRGFFPARARPARAAAARAAAARSATRGDGSNWRCNPLKRLVCAMR
jgi:hypothetical protein